MRARYPQTVPVTIKNYFSRTHNSARLSAMLKLILLKLWPALIPLGFYLIWVLILSRRVGDGRRIAEHVRRSMLFWAIMASIVLLIGSFVFWGFTQQENKAGTYVPPTVVDGELVPGHVAPDNTNVP